MKSIRFALLLFFIMQIAIVAMYYDTIMGKISVWKGKDDALIESKLQRNSTNPTVEGDIISNKIILQQACVPSRNIVYIKTHKTASSTLYAIIQKYRRRIRIENQAIHFPLYYIGGYPGHFRSNLTFYKNADDVLLKYSRDHKPSEMLLSGHIRFHRDEILSFMPPNPKFITILRSPFRQFESAYHNFYQHYEQYTNRSTRVPCVGQPIYHVMGRTQAPMPEYLERAKFALDDGSLPWFFRSRNFQSFDLGLDPLNKDEDYLRKSISQLDAVMDLVLIADYFEESLVLLKHTLCMNWEDFNVPSHFVRDYERHTFTETEKDVVRYLHNQDFILFDHFNKTFWRKVDEFGRDNMEQELRSLRSMKLSKIPQKKTLSRRKRNISPHSHSLPLADRDHLFKQLLVRIEKESNGWPGREAALEVAKHMTNNHGLCSYY